ncbi:YibE/F family protein [Thermodesulfatator indicus DSM 15286]|uniref:YibE/F family protein n=1 Tax=Thermodesulfatator indicus (strain DSM 15286 / JCM 11887 / CIR29812) TaxID=667014 RepID=F8ABL9_THEID|nr:YibE/F family protein [Thermodesulfatator indicus]AEH45619.1 YibE/F family protein [Thermodesulfatator indicus DSM 15286]
MPFNKKDFIMACFFLCLSVILFFYPNKFEHRTERKSIRCKGLILKVDNSDIIQHGLVKTGTQDVVVKILDGPFKGKILKSTNQLLGQLDIDKIFKPGDKVLVVLSLTKDNKIFYVNAQDIYRIDIELILFLSFAFFLVVFGGWIGLRALLSFIFTVLVVWKILIPTLLNGINPIYLSVGIVIIIVTAIIFLVGGLNQKSLVAFLGSILGVITTCILAIYATKKAHIHGAVMPFSEPLLYSGFEYLDLTKIYIGAIFLSASGALMDLSMDIASSMDELVKKRPDLSFFELALSGMTVCRYVMGTMVTTLLLAYCGEYISVLMFFMAQGVPLVNFLNFVYVAAEIIKTLVGSFGLVLTGPFTAIVGAMLLKKSSQNREKLLRV